MKQLIWGFIFVLAMLSIWHWGFEPQFKVNADIASNGYHYIGNITLTNNEYAALKDSLSQRDVSLQQNNDLTVLNISDNGSVTVDYNFLSTQNYTYLTYKPVDPILGGGNSIVPIIYFLFVALTTIKIVMPHNTQSNTVASNDTTPTED